MYSRASGLPFAVYAYAASVLAHPRLAPAHANTMTRDDAARMVRALLEAHGAGRGAEVFKGGDRLGVMLGRAEIFFEYDEEGGTLSCEALIYRFRREPRPGVLQRFFAEEAGGALDASGGALEYRYDNRALLLGRHYTEPLPAAQFAADMKRLAEASLVWGEDILERVAASAKRES